MLALRRGREPQLMCGVIDICQSPSGKKVGGVLAPATYDDDVPEFQCWVVGEIGAYNITYYFGLTINSVSLVYFDGGQLFAVGNRALRCTER